MTNSGGGTVTSNAVIINPVIQPSVSIIASDTSICAGSSVTYTLTPVNPGTNPTYQWQVNASSTGGR